MQSDNERKENRHQRRMARRKQSSSMQINNEESHAEDTAKRTRKEQKRKQKEERRKHKKPRRRIFPIWLRILTIIIGCIGAVVAGVMVGYGVIGDGAPNDALLKDTWQHIIDIVRKKE